jgi:hypothetical protein
MPGDAEYATYHLRLHKFAIALPLFNRETMVKGLFITYFIRLLVEGQKLFEGLLPSEWGD